MSKPLRFLVMLAVGAGCHGKDAATTPNPTTATGTDGTHPPEAVDVDPILSSSHEGVPVALEVSNHVSVTVTSAQGDLHFFVDSGASSTVISTDLAAALGIHQVGQLPVLLPKNELQVGTTDLSGLAGVVDLTLTNQEIEAEGEDPIDGLVGAPFLVSHHAVLDYPDTTLYVQTTKPTTDLAQALDDALEGNGYGKVQAALNLIDFVNFQSSVDGSDDLNSIVDSGAGATLIEYATASALGLDLQTVSGTAATINGTHDIYETTVGDLTLAGSYSLTDRTVAVVDLSAINDQLTAAGLDPIQVLVGGDVLIGQDAVLDYLGQRLFLLPQ